MGTELSRREWIELVAGAGVIAATGCTPSSGPLEVRAHREGPAPTEGADAVERIARLAPQWPTRDPFLFCVHHDDHYPASNGRFGPAASLAGRRVGMDFEGIDGWRMYHGQAVPGFPSHPHRGFETVTVVRRGLLDHADSMGAAARYGAGDVQWLTAGRGIQHAEMFPLLHRDRPNPVELFQIWLNLPQADKMADPHFSMLWASAIPHRVVRDANGASTELTLVAGRHEDAATAPPPPSSYASREDADVAIWTIAMAPSARFSLPPARPGTDRRLYYFQGRGMRAAGRAVPPDHYVDLRGDRAVTLENGASPSEMLLLQGRPIGEPVARRGPFVMNTDDEIRQAYADYQRTRFGGWPWPSSEPVHGAAGERFARHADGRVDRPT
jgi:redox-sensitive bicupin YhaK (pirin superfamily)